ncbi:MAG: hypothetical protein B6D61_10550 [Bacteroidetes bacterium 4484_249]|nr:MAG: hypothetical protein B6D61_10550 [Bacteroidetes bacterium 4484_249]
MKKLTFYLFAPLTMLLLFIVSGNVSAQGVTGDVIANLTDVQKYYRAIHVMAMLLLGFGFLMVFVRKYGRSALTATFLLVSISVPLYYFLSNSGIFGDKGSEIDKLILAEFGAASLLITAGAVLGRLKIIDTCGVSNLHGIPGLFGGLVALIVVSGINYPAQLSGIGLTIVIAIIAGIISGKILSFFGHPPKPYLDSVGFDVED